jgi:hypothetical protein
VAIVFSQHNLSNNRVIYVKDRQIILKTEDFSKDHSVVKTTEKKTMVGAEEALGDNVYPYNNLKGGDRYTRTTEVLFNYFEKKIEDVGAEVADTIRNMEKLDLSKREPKEQMEEKEGNLAPKTLTRF